MLTTALARWMGWCVRHAGLVLAAAALLAAGSLLLVWTQLGVTTDTSALFSDSLPWRRHTAVLQRAFPQDEGLLVAVIDGATPEEADATAEALATALSADTARFRGVWRPDASPYFARNGLLFLDPATLGGLLDRTIDAQPFLGQLAGDPSLRGLMGALGLIAEGVRIGQANLEPFEPALQGFHTALAAAAAGAPQPLSWQRLLTGPVSDLGGRFRFVLTQPRLDAPTPPGAIEPDAATAIRDAASRLEFVQRGRAQVRLTGSVALETEEFATVAHGAILGLLGSLTLVTGVLFLALRSWRLVLPVLIVLGLGLVLTAGFAALAVGTLNLVSVAFAVLFVGIAVDFGIQVCVRFREERQRVPSVPAALERTARRAGRQVLVAALASAAGFVAFLPSDFVGVAQLGLIAGAGVVMAFATTMTALPALLVLFAPRVGAAQVGATEKGAEETGIAWLRPLDAVVVRGRWPVLALFAALTVAGGAALPRLRFDGDPLATKDPAGEAVRTLRDLMGDPLTSPYTIEILARSSADAAVLATRLRALPLVGGVLTLRSFVPGRQDQTLPLVADAAGMLDTTLAMRASGARPDAAALRASVQTAAAALLAVRDRVPGDSTLRRIGDDLMALARVSDRGMLAADTALTRFLPLQLDRLRVALSARPATEADVPPEIARDWVLPDGRARIRVAPLVGARDTERLLPFVQQVQAVVPDAGGPAVTIIGSADTIISAFRGAAAWALLAITVILGVALRRVRDVAIVLTALLVSSMLTVLAAVLLPLPLNFANIIALPLLLGVGVSFNIYFVMNWRAGQTGPLGSSTARAVVFSALATAAAFGALAVSHHPGTASMGALLLLSLGCTIVTTLVFVPALLARAPRV